MYTVAENDTSSGGTGARLGGIVVILAGVAAISATLATVVSTWSQFKNYRKPLLQRNVVRILLMVPIYSAASWVSLVSLKVAFWIGPFRDVYEAFTIYTFFQLLINFIGGERALILLTYGRPPVSHLWPLNHLLPKIDISDPHTFLAIKRGILQYTWLRPMLAIANVIMKATGTYQEGYIGLKSGYFWSGLIYNVSITVCLYALALFWICMSEDLQNFRPMPKFLCIKGIIFASYWQGFFLSILVWLGAIPDDVPGYSQDNLAAAIQDGLICFEMPIFAIAHWYAFSWHDYADPTISAARLPVKYAMRDAFGVQDLIQDSKETFGGKNYDYRSFEARNNILAHEDSSSRMARMMQGMRYERGGKGKYWIPAPETNSKTPLLQDVAPSSARAMNADQGLSNNVPRYDTICEEGEDVTLDEEDETLYTNARALEFGDWNYPVITAHTASREDRLYAEPEIITSSTNRHLLQPTKDQKKRRKSRIKNLQEDAKSKKNPDTQSHNAKDPQAHSSVSAINGLFGQKSSSSKSNKACRSQLVDLVVEDHQAEEVERVRARKEGSPAWNEDTPKQYVRTYPPRKEESMQHKFAPDEAEPHNPEQSHNLDTPLLGDKHVSQNGSGSHNEDERRMWDERDLDQSPPQKVDIEDEPNPWDTPSKGKS